LCLEFGRNERAVRVVDHLSFSVAAGEFVGLVGESGSGKSLTALSIGRLVPTPPARYAHGTILLEGRDVLRMSPRNLRGIRGGVVSYVFQEPGTSLNPVLRVGTQIREALALHRPSAATHAEIVQMLRLVNLPDPESRARSFPHELSGGMQQRVMIAMALASRPRLLVADEPTTALDVTIQAQIVRLLRDLQREFGMAVLFITHNLALVGDIADRIAVMYAGQIVEVGPATALLARPLHPYTRALRAAVPELGQHRGRLPDIPGSVAVPGRWPEGCRFHPRCPHARDECRVRPMELVELEPGRWVRCPFAREIA
jgi:peptide/nickel transport system ATP-binding protein/oligopeptide transport system ATP-binding protein